jgi:iron(III) transport system ATP-binding protein
LEGIKDPQSSYLSIKNLWKSFGSFTALKDVSLDIQEGEFVCFLGPSGCGKTTLLRAIAGLDLQTSGILLQGGKDISNFPASERDYGIVFQSYALFPNLTIEKNISFGLENTGRSKSEINERVLELLHLIGLPDQGPKYPAQLSGGQQQRIALARAIASGPGLLLLDEPLSALDAKVRVYLRHEIKTLQQKLGVTTIMVTHDQEEALSMADRIVVMNEGKVEQIGSPNEVYCKPQTLFVADFIGEMTQFTGTTSGRSSVKIGNTELNTMAHQFGEGHEVSLTIRPEDIIPLGAKLETKKGASNSTKNIFSTKLEEMEFLGSFWRCKLKADEFSEALVTADFSVNAVRRLSLEPNQNLWIEVPSESILAFNLQVN